MNSGCDRSFTKKVPNKVCQNTATDEDQCSNAVVSPNLAAKVISSPGVSTDTVLTNKDTVTVIYVCAPLFVMYQLLHIVHTMYI